MLPRRELRLAVSADAMAALAISMAFAALADIWVLRRGDDVRLGGPVRLRPALPPGLGGGVVEIAVATLPLRGPPTTGTTLRDGVKGAVNTALSTVSSWALRDGLFRTTTVLAASVATEDEFRVSTAGTLSVAGRPGVGTCGVRSGFNTSESATAATLGRESVSGASVTTGDAASLASFSERILATSSSAFFWAAIRLSSALVVIFDRCVVCSV
mmetsp:Transcript_10816/g.21984  ORF Transcript_10816/g.21984 Transcript_10816/m.21984 type:complete len:214 (+) Transcript_10816:501-1142(+)